MDDDQLAGLAGIKATLILADYAIATEGKLTVVGGGWNLTTPEPSPFSVAMIFELPITEVGEKHEFQLELIDVDGNPVHDLTTDQQVSLNGEFGLEVPEGMEVLLPRALVTINHPGLHLEPGKQMEWRLSIDGVGREDWRLQFHTTVSAEQMEA